MNLEKNLIKKIPLLIFIGMITHSQTIVSLASNDSDGNNIVSGPKKRNVVRDITKPNTIHQDF